MASVRDRASNSLPILLFVFVSFAVAEERSDEVARLLESAEGAYVAADFETAARSAEEVIARLAQTAPSEERNTQLARAYAVSAEIAFNLGEEEKLAAAIDAMLESSPAHQLDIELAGPDLIERIENRRRERVGTLSVSCRPMPCEELTIDGARRTVDSSESIPLIAGVHRIRGERHGFEASEDGGEIEIVAGETAALEIVLRQTARDVRLQTAVEGVHVTFDRTPVGTTASDELGGVPRLVLHDVPPGMHVLILEKECHRRLEQKVDVVIDELDPHAIDLGTIELTRSVAVVDLQWDREQGRLSIDGRDVRPGRIDVCPGVRELSLSLGGRRVWFDRIEIDEGEEHAIVPIPRPTIAILGEATSALGDARGIVGEKWNRLSLVLRSDEDSDRGPAHEVTRWLDAVCRDETIPLFPRSARMRDDAFVRQLAALAPEADLLAFWWSAPASVRPMRVLVFVDPSSRSVELTGWLESNDRAETEAAALLAAETRTAVPFLGFDLAERRGDVPVIAAVSDGGPAARAGLDVGDLLLAVDGAAFESLAEWDDVLEGLKLPARMTLAIDDGAETRDVSLDVAANISVTSPAVWRENVLLPALARARVDAVALEGVSRLAGNLTAGMILVALGDREDAARLLDRASIEPRLDPSGDARGSVLHVLESIFRELGNVEYAGEMRARREALTGARFGGRRGPPLSADR